MDKTPKAKSKGMFGKLKGLFGNKKRRTRSYEPPESKVNEPVEPVADDDSNQRDHSKPSNM